MGNLEMAIAVVAEECGLDGNALQAIAEVESGGRIFARVGERNEPLIRFEGHYFYRLLPRAKRNRAVAAGLANKIAGKVRNPVGQPARWRLLARAGELDHQAALESASWGLGQVMGCHWRWLGYASIDAMVIDVRSGATGQLRLMARFIREAGLAPLLEAHDWAGFARRYNGPGFRKNGYDRKMADAFARLEGKPATPRRNEMAVLTIGSFGNDVEWLQHILRQMGYPLIADGDFGPATSAAVLAFQRDAGIACDGMVGARTMEALQRRLPPRAA
ncbi:MAG: N-acetylmuramidase domain-containing protein [Rhizobiaceae bacterium]